MRAAIVLLAATVAAGCYSPAAKSGGYQCDSTDTSGDACPSGLTCKCGSCVVGDGDEACSFRIDFADDAPACTDKEAQVCTTENSTVTVKVSAFSASLAPADPNAAPSRYSGTAVLTSSWGHPHYAPFSFVNGVASVPITLDRATPPNSTAVLFAKQGEAFGQSSGSVIVDPQPFTVDAAAAITVNQAPWISAALGYPAIDHGSTGYTMYFVGAANTNKGTHPTIGNATSSDGITWTTAQAPLVQPTGYAYSPSVLHLSDSDIRLFFAEQQMPSDPFSVQQLQSSDQGMTFGPPASMPPPLGADSCAFCEPTVGLNDPWAVQDPSESSVWRVFFTLTAGKNARATSTLGVARTDDGGASWQADPVPTPGTGEAAALEFDVAPRVTYDRTAKIWRMYYAKYRFVPGVTLVPAPCTTDIDYATSEDGQFWTGVRQPPANLASLPAAALRAEDVAWAATANPYQTLFPTVGLYPGGMDIPTDVSQPTALWFTVMARAYSLPQGHQTCDPLEATCAKCKPADGCDLATCCADVQCIPVAIGRATHN